MNSSCGWNCASQTTKKSESSLKNTDLTKISCFLAKNDYPVMETMLNIVVRQKSNKNKESNERMKTIGLIKTC